MNRSFRKSLSVLLCLIILLLQTSPVLAARTVRSVPQYSQQPYDQLCWATTSAMIISFFKGDTTNRNLTIAKAEYGTTNFNQTAPITTDKKYINQYTGKAGSIQYNPLSYSAVQYQIKNNAPIDCTIIWSNGGGHALAIKGFDTAVSSSEVLYNDPWDGKGHGASYSFFKSNSSWSWTESLFFK